MLTQHYHRHTSTARFTSISILMLVLLGSTSSFGRCERTSDGNDPSNPPQEEMSSGGGSSFGDPGDGLDSDPGDGVLIVLISSNRFEYLTITCIYQGPNYRKLIIENKSSEDL